jgi:hypothetical protein
MQHKESAGSNPAPATKDKKAKPFGRVGMGNKRTVKGGKGLT